MLYIPALTVKYVKRELENTAIEVILTFLSLILLAILLVNVQEQQQFKDTISIIRISGLNLAILYDNTG